ncbi:hypothetical protein [Cytophaga aurantiaca]|uniref:hypothetical protein n=1 Tax=Cytophaga aurantiaca TaxID=29530 RepID=UPI00037E5BDB|nr:hypothetical protein [Cytophaga aurantiaca]
MKKHISIVSLILFLFTIWSCNNREFAEVKKLSEYKKTSFLPTLEHSINSDTNAVYCVTLLYAWDEVRKLINHPFIINPDFYDLQTLNNSKSFLNVLQNNEYEASGEVDGFSIKTRAEFTKSLPFEFKLQSFTNKLIFNKQKVASFGMIGNNEDLTPIIKIVYYKNDANFIIKLLPKDKEHEILLFQSDKKFHSLKEMHAEIQRLTVLGNKERLSNKTQWKYYFSEEDELIIPKFNFNIETNYKTLEGKSFQASTQTYSIDKVWQRTAFMLDEAGAEIESEAVIEVAADGPDENTEKPKPKKMIFNRSFLTLLKRTDAPYPYFALWTTNAELMVKE